MSKTKAALYRFSRLHDLGCICCRKKGWFDQGIQVHHIVGKGPRDDMKTLPLCPHHHQGTPLFGWGKRETTSLLGPSLRDSKRKFIEVFGDELELLKEVNEMLTG